MSEIALPCPFCGVEQDAKLDVYGFFQVKCDCFLHGEVVYPEEWNRRAIANREAAEPSAWALKGPLGLAATLFFSEAEAAKHTSAVLSVVPVFLAPLSASAEMRDALIEAEKHHRFLANRAHSKGAGITMDKHALVADVLESLLSRHTKEQRK